jgi:hypothetical protein
MPGHFQLQIEKATRWDAKDGQKALSPAYASSAVRTAQAPMM